MSPYFQGLDDETMRVAFAKEEARILREEMAKAAKAGPRWLAALAFCAALLALCLVVSPPLDSPGFSLLDFVLLPVAGYVALTQYIQARRRLRDLKRQCEEHKAFLRKHARDPAEFYLPEVRS
jgi:hypothetical protein